MLDIMPWARLRHRQSKAAQIVLHRDPTAEPERTRRCWEDHLKRAKWMTETGYRKILTGDRDRLQ